MRTHLPRLLLTLSIGAALLGAVDSRAVELETEPGATTAAALPSTVDLRDQFEQWGLGPRRQGRRPTCSVFTVAGALEFALAKENRQGVELSVEYLNWASNRALGVRPRDRGQFFHNLLRAYQHFGVCDERLMPYQWKFDSQVTPSKEARANAEKIRSSEVTVHWINPLKRERGLTDSQFQQVKQTLVQGWPVAAGAAHSRLLVGYRDDPQQPGGGVFLTKDSGKGKFAKVSYQFVKEKVGDVFWIESQSEPMADSQ